MGISAKIVTLKLTGAVVIDGLIARAGTLVEMVEDEAKDLLRRGKAELHAIAEKIEGEGEGDDDSAAQAAAAQAAADAAQNGAAAAGDPPEGTLRRARKSAE